MEVLISYSVHASVHPVYSTNQNDPRGDSVKTVQDLLTLQHDLPRAGVCSSSLEVTSGRDIVP